jgi:hypothetical protein
MNDTMDQLRKDCIEALMRASIAANQLKQVKHQLVESKASNLRMYSAIWKCLSYAGMDRFLSDALANDVWGITATDLRELKRAVKL